MRNRFCLRQVVNKEKRRLLFSWTCIPVCVLAIILTPMEGQCSKSEMFSTDKHNTQNLTLSPSNVAELTVQSNSLDIKQGSEATHKNRTFESAAIQSEEQDFTEEAQSSKPITDSTVVDSIENAILPEPDYEATVSTSSLPDLTEKQLESTEDDAEEREHESMASSTREMESFYDEEESSSKSITVNAYDDEFEVMRNAITGKPKATRLSTTIPIPVTTKAAPSRSTPRGSRNKYPILKKVPTRLIAVSKNKVKSTTTTIRPTKKVVRNTTKKPMKATKTPRPLTPTPRHHRNPHHPHGVVVFDKRKKRPKPGKNKNRHKTKPSKTTTTTTARTTTTTTSTPSPSESEEYFEYYWSSGENTESTEVTSYNSTSSNTTTTPNKKRISSKIPLSKLAMAMIASSAIFDNSTGSEDGLYYPKTPVNLLNILQSYTKQLQLANAESAVKQPMVQIQSSPFMLQLSQLPFGTRIAISIYYSLIAIIPLVYLAFGGLGRLGFLNAFAGRGFGRRRRRRRRSYGGDHFGLHSRYQTPVIQRAELNDRNEDEYMWILGRISEIILEFSLLSDDEREQ